jgi:hypothetical protein
MNDFQFYATFDVDSLASYIPAGTAVLLPASSWSRKNLAKPRIPAHITDLGADCGGFVASRIWGEYRYTLDQYVTWLRSWSPNWAATMDYCCEEELYQVTKDRQKKTTDNAWAAWKEYKDAPWAWCPTIQGFDTNEYARHVKELLPLILEMKEHYKNNSAWRVGIGTLCRRNNVVDVQEVINSVLEVLPQDIKIHLWGIKLDALRSITLGDRPFSTDSAVHHQAMYAKNEIKSLAAAAGMSMREYKIKVNLPSYITKVNAAVAESKMVTAAQSDDMMLEQARKVLRENGLTIHIRTRRNRKYIYGAWREGKKVKEISICPVSKLGSWLLNPVVQRPSSTLTVGQ